MITYGYHKGKIRLEEIQKLMSENAARRYGLYPDKGSIALGADADLTIVNLNEKWFVDPSKLESKGKYSVVAGKEMVGKVSKTILRGKLIYDEKAGITGEKGYGNFIKSNL
jgi:dihydroorotase-like cyclic amidohydrolase